MSDAEQIVSWGPDRIVDLRPLYLSLHDHHRKVSTLPLTSPDDHAWAARAATYEDAFAEGSAILHVAVSQGRAIGYAFAILHDATDDTFALAPRYAELYTLVVSPEARGRGVGERLLDALRHWTS